MPRIGLKEISGNKKKSIMRLWVLNECYLYEATQFALDSINNDEQRNAQRKGYINKRLVFYTDLLYQATESFYLLKTTVLLDIKETQHNNKKLKPYNFPSQGLAMFLQSLLDPDH